MVEKSTSGHQLRPSQKPNRLWHLWPTPLYHQYVLQGGGGGRDIMWDSQMSLSLTHTHTHRHTHTDTHTQTHTHTHMHTHTHSLLQVHLSVIWLSTTPTSPICSSFPLRYPPSPSYLMASPPSTPTTPIPSELAMATTPGDHAHYPTWLHPSCHCRYGCTHTRGDLLSLVLSHARPHPMTNTVNIPSAYMHAISHNHITICRIHVSVVLITKNRFEYHVVHLHTCNSVTCT